MKWNEHYELSGQHAFLSASGYHWLGYNPDKLVDVYKNMRAKVEGIELHEFASSAIKKGIKLSKTRNTLNMFVNDCIAFKMQSEVMLFYSVNSFGTADAISFKDNILRVFDYKTGVVKASFKQLDIYVALFCLEYMVNPKDIRIEQRIYQNNDYIVQVPDPEYIQSVMDKIEEFDQIIEIVKSTLT